MSHPFFASFPRPKHTMGTPVIEVWIQPEVVAESSGYPNLFLAVGGGLQNLHQWTFMEGV